jgi:hypothetical protein
VSQLNVELDRTTARLVSSDGQPNPAVGTALKAIRKMKSGTIVLTGSALLSPAGAFAQVPALEPDTSDLQRQLQEMRSQMDRMQSRIDELESAQANIRTNPRAQPEQTQPGPSLGPTPPRAKPSDSTGYRRFVGMFGSGPWVFTRRLHQADLIHDRRDWLDRFFQPAQRFSPMAFRHEHSVSREGDAPVAQHRGAGRG